MAMCELVHLATMKHYYLRFINLMTTRLEAETGLRNPTILESQSADKTLMTSACDLVMEKQWSFDDAIHEITFIRAEINTLLQARPKLHAQTYQRLNPLPLRGRGNHIVPRHIPKRNQLAKGEANHQVSPVAKSSGLQKLR